MIRVLKLGSSVLPTADALPAAVTEIYRFVRRGERVVVVVSALGDTTDRLLARGRAVGASGGALACLLATGEAEATALLALALDRAGIPAALLDPAQAGLRGEGDPLDARLVGVDRAALLGHLDGRPVVVIPGFVARAPDGSTCVLGRGGSDLTAVVVAGALGARCRLVKDVPGLAEWDPRRGGSPRIYARIPWDEARAIGGRVVQEKALLHAEALGLPVEVGALGSDDGTIVGPGPAEIADIPPRGPLRVGLLGLGTVGLGVYRHLAARPDRFTVTGVAVRDPARHADDRVAPGLLCADPWAVLDGCDVVVELLGGLDPALPLVEAALRRGRAVVTANKRLVAEHGDALRAIPGARLSWSAAVGGALPVLEAVERLAGDVLSIEGVVNGTCNYVLDRLAEGHGWDEALRGAREAGFAEADPSDDLEGRDAASKLVLLARAAFGRSPIVRREGIAGLDPAEVHAEAARGRRIRLVARCDGTDAVVRPEALPPSHPLASTRDEENRVVVTTRTGTVLLHGKGAGRWPTAESVLADLLALGGAP